MGKTFKFQCATSNCAVKNDARKLCCASRNAHLCYAFHEITLCNRIFAIDHLHTGDKQLAVTAPISHTKLSALLELP